MGTTIIKSDQSNSDESDSVVFDYQPKEFPLVLAKPAQDFVNKQTSVSSDFNISPLVAEQAGIAELNRQNIEARAEAEALERLKGVEEKAYKEAYNLGLEEGREHAIQEHRNDFLQRLSKLDDLLNAFNKIKEEVLEQNEHFIVKLCYDIGKQLAMREIQLDRNVILDVLQQVVQEAQTEDQITIRISQEDFDFIEEIRVKSEKKLGFLKSAKLEVSESIESGGCYLESNYGTINANVSERFAKAWQIVADKLPHLSQGEDEKDKE